MEIERKFLVTSEQWRAQATEVFAIRQGYLTRDPDRIVRIRIKADAAFLTIKGAPHPGASALVREEFEYPLPLADGEHLLQNFCLPPVIEKRRAIVPGPDGKCWEVDEYIAPHGGLVVAEIELSAHQETFAAPDWLGREVTHDPRYINHNLAAAVFD